MRAPTRIALLSSVGAAATALAVVVAPLAAFADEAAVAAASAASDKIAVVEKSAKVAAKGAAVKLPLTYTCTAGWDGYIGVSLVQTVDGGFASSNSWKQVKCTGKAKTVTLYLQASPGQGAKPFEEGTASLVGSLDSSDPLYDPCMNGGCEGAAPIAPARAMPPPGSSIFTSASTPLLMQKQVPYYKHTEFHQTIKIED